MAGTLGLMRKKSAKKRHKSEHGALQGFFPKKTRAGEIKPN